MGIQIHCMAVVTGTNETVQWPFISFHFNRDLLLLSIKFEDVYLLLYLYFFTLGDKVIYVINR